MSREGKRFERVKNTVARTLPLGETGENETKLARRTWVLCGPLYDIPLQTLHYVTDIQSTPRDLRSHRNRFVSFRYISPMRWAIRLQLSVPPNRIHGYLIHRATTTGIKMFPLGRQIREWRKFPPWHIHMLQCVRIYKTMNLKARRTKKGKTRARATAT